MAEQSRWRSDERSRDEGRGRYGGEGRGYGGGWRDDRGGEDRDRWARGPGGREGAWSDDRGSGDRDSGHAMRGDYGRDWTGFGESGRDEYGRGEYGPPRGGLMSSAYGFGYGSGPASGHGYGYEADDRGRDMRRGGGRDDWRSGRGEDRGMWERTRDEVSSWFGDDDAERRRRMDRQEEHRGRGPRGYRRSDDRIREDVNDRLTDDPYIDASEVEVAVKDCEVTLTGWVRQRGDKRRAEDIAERVSGVQHVQNNLRVQPSAAAIGTGGIPEGSTSAGHTSTSGTTSGTTARASRGAT
jgi:hypothetical protein